MIAGFLDMPLEVDAARDAFHRQQGLRCAGPIDLILDTAWRGLANLLDIWVPKSVRIGSRLEEISPSESTAIETGSWMISTGSDGRMEPNGLGGFRWEPNASVRAIKSCSSDFGALNSVQSFAAEAPRRNSQSASSKR